MNKKYIIRKNEEIEKLIKVSKKKVNDFFVIYYLSNNNNYNRYCISVSKKVGKAYVRNYYKRVVKDIITKNKYNNSCNYVIILRTAIIGASYEVIKSKINKLLED